MPQGTVANTLGFMKEVTRGPIRESFANEAHTWNQFGTLPKTEVSSRGVLMAIHLEPNMNYTFMADGGVLPAGSSETVKPARAYFQTFVLPVSLTDDAIAATGGGDAVAFGNNLIYHAQAATKNALKAFNMLLWAQNGNGVVGTIPTGAASATQTLGTTNGTRWLRPGMLVDVYSSDLATLRTGSPFTINSVSPSTPSITLSASVTSSANDVVIAAGAVNRAIHGIPYHINDTGFWQEIDRGTYFTSKAQLINASSTSLSLALLSRLVARVRNAMGAERPKRVKIYSWEDQVFAYLTLGFELKQFTGAKFDGSYTSYEFQGIEWRVDQDHPGGEVTVFDLNDFEMVKASDGDLMWDEATGDMWLREVDQATGRYKSSLYAFLKARCDVAGGAQSGNGRITSLAIPSGFLATQISQF